MKRTIVAMLMSLMVLSLTACGNELEKQPESVDTDISEDVAVETEDKMAEQEENKVEYQKVFAGDTVSCKFVDIEFGELATGDEIQTGKGIKTSIYSEDGSETYMYVPVVMTNTYNNTVELTGNISSSFLINDEYTYEGSIEGNGREIPALSNMTVFLVARVPKTIAESYETVNVKIGIDNSADYNQMYKELEERDELFEYEVGTVAAKESEAARPGLEYEKVADGQELTFDNFILTLDTMYQGEEISEKTGSITYSQSPNNKNNVYVYLMFNVKNTSNDVIELSTIESCMSGVFVVDDEFEYEAKCVPIKNIDLGAFEETNLYLKAEVAPEILDKIVVGKTNVKFGVNDDLKYDGISKVEKSDHIYEYVLDLTQENSN